MASNYNDVNIFKFKVFFNEIIIWEMSEFADNKVNHF